MSEKPKPEKDDEAQSKRFIDTAKQLEADETGEAFERALGIVAPPTPPVDPKK